MNEYITLIENLRAAADGHKKTNTALEADLDKIITGDTIKARYEARKNNAAAIDNICKKISENNAAAEVVNLAIKIAVEMYAKEAANRVIDAIKAGAKNLLDTPMHYKKFKAAAAEALKDDNGVMYNHYYNFMICYPYYSPIGNYEITVLYTSTEGIITEADAEKATKYDLIPAADIVKTAAAAIQAKKEVDAIKEAAKKEVDAIKARFNTVYAVNID